MMFNVFCLSNAMPEMEKLFTGGEPVIRVPAEGHGLRPGSDRSFFVVPEAYTEAYNCDD